MQSRTHLRRCEQYLDRCRFQPDALRVLALGDSWLSLPGALWDGHDIVEFLNKPRWTDDHGGPRLNVLSFAHPGKELRHMARDSDLKEGLAFLEEFGRMRSGDFRFEAMMVTGGGNDILPFPDRFIGPGDGNGEVLDVPLNRALDDIRASWNDILALAARWQCPVIAHGYGPITPTLKSGGIRILRKGIGPWVGPHLLRTLRLPVARAKALIGEVIDRLNDTMQDIDRLFWFDVRDTVAAIPAKDWHDEIHFFEPGWEALAERWLEAIVRFAGRTDARAASAVSVVPRASRKRVPVAKAPEIEIWKPFVKQAAAEAAARAEAKEKGAVAKTKSGRAGANRAVEKKTAAKTRGAKKAGKKRG